ncbi:DUF4105 domain-containing protein [Dongia sp.]|uniref:Lnb N-terminal periplasmic domain-containing protein n=1 Tax=Dongia sp. TaxID=1977262 RepID=UPI0035AF7DDC
MGVRLAATIVRCLFWILLAGLSAWCIAALAIDGPGAWRWLLLGLYLLALFCILWRGRAWARRLLSIALCGIVLIWWLSLRPSDARIWQKDVDRTAWADIAGDAITLHNVRNFDYHSEFDYTPRWEERSYLLSDITGLDVSITYWGSPWIAHPILSFAFRNGDRLAFSVETRKELGEEYSALRGFFRRYELIYIVADERDVIRLRTNYRQGEEVYLYHTTASAADARAIFLDYLGSLNQLHERPRFYNALTSNCTSNIRIHTAAAAGPTLPPWDWRLLLNGKSDEFAYEHGRLAGDLPFDALKAAAHINDAARAADQAADFSQRIRTGRPGF